MNELSEFCVTIVMKPAAVNIPIYIYLNTTKKLPVHLQSGNRYLLFDEYWGNNRGSSWMIAVKSFLKGDFVRKIFGCGPDG